jgi:predicted PurR-regulated permease PerM
MSVFNYKQRNNIVLVIIIFLGCAIIYSLRTIFGAVLSTIILYTIFRPLFLILITKWKFKRWLASISIIAVSLVIIVLPFLALSLMVLNKIAELQQNPLKMQYIIHQIDVFLGSKLRTPHVLENALNNTNKYISELFPSLVTGAADILLGVVVMYFLLYFMLVQMEEFEAGLLRYAPFREQNALKFATELKNITNSNIIGQGFIALVQGSLLSIGFYLFGIPDAIFWGVIGVFLSFLPIIGPPIIFIPAAIIELASGNKTGGIGLLIYGVLLVGNIDNFIRFIIAKRLTQTHPLITVIGVFIGIPVFGILGLVFGPLLLSYFILTIRIYETSKLASDRLERIRAENEE